MSNLFKNLEFDPDLLIRKYEEERNKRLRPEGNGQYLKISGQYEEFGVDPYTAFVERDPIDKEVEIAILGGGFAALMSGARLREAGFTDIWMLEQGGDFGGTWYWNRYPGAACDTESLIYLPMLEEVGTLPTRKYVKAPEIWAHAKAIAGKYDLYRNALFHTRVERLEWDEGADRWIVSTDRQDTIRAHYFILASGALQVPKLPGIPGIETFKGQSFHTSRWDYDYTGGDAAGNLTGLADKRVALIGTGATAVQCAPHLAASARHLYVFQRTPSSVGMRNDHELDPEWLKSQPEGWHRKRVENFTTLLEFKAVEEDLVKDGWTGPAWATVSGLTPDMTQEDLGQHAQMVDFRTMEAARSRIDEIVDDTETAEALKPWYNWACKRPCFHDEYLQTYNRPNVTLIDTAGRGVDEITERGVVVDSKTYEVDCIIYATGFELGAFTRHEAFPILGRGGRSLADKWRDGATTLHGFSVCGFPNLFFQGTTQSAWGSNFTHMLEIQASHIAYILGQARARGISRIEASAQAEAAWVSFHEAESEKRVAMWKDCTPGYFNNEGQMSPVVRRNGGFGGGVTKLSAILKAWREAGTLEGLLLDGSPASRAAAVSADEAGS